MIVSLRPLNTRKSSFSPRTCADQAMTSAPHLPTGPMSTLLLLLLATAACAFLPPTTTRPLAPSPPLVRLVGPNAANPELARPALDLGLSALADDSDEGGGAGAAAEAEAAGSGADEDGGGGGEKKRRVVVIGAGWGGMSAAHALSKDADTFVTVVDASPRAGGLVRDGFTTMSGNRPAEAGQHGFWDNYHNIFQLLEDLPNVNVDDVLTGYAEQGQYSPGGLEAVWPVYRDMKPRLPTGPAQALYTRFINLPLLDRATAVPLVLAFSEFDDSPEAWERYDRVSFRDLCAKLGVSKRCYDEAFEPMILTGLFAPGEQCSAAAALGMAYFFVLKGQNAFDVRWCKGNIGDKIFQPWAKHMEKNGVEFEMSSRVVGFDTPPTSSDSLIERVRCRRENGEEFELLADAVVFAVGASALGGMVRSSPSLARHADFRRFANLRGTGVLATRLFLDRKVDIPYSANACWGFDKGVGMTFFDISVLHGQDASTTDGAPGTVVEVDYYHAASLLVMSDEAIVAKAKSDLDKMLGRSCSESSVSDAAVVRLPGAVNWYYPGSYADMPDVTSSSISNAYFAGDIVRSRHGSWSQEKAYVTGVEASNAVLGKDDDQDVIPLQADEAHVMLGKEAVRLGKTLLGRGDAWNAPSLVDFLW